MECPNCKFENKNSNIRCENCGIQLIPEEEMNIEETEINKEQKIIKNSQKEYKSYIFNGKCDLFFGVMLILIFLFFVIFSMDIGVILIHLPILFFGIWILVIGKNVISKGENMKKALNYFENGENQKVSELFKNHKQLEKKDKNGVKGIIGISFCFFFLILIFIDYKLILNWNYGGSWGFFFTLIFWVSGIKAAIDNLKE